MKRYILIPVTALACAAASAQSTFTTEVEGIVSDVTANVLIALGAVSALIALAIGIRFAIGMVRRAVHG